MTKENNADSTFEHVEEPNILPDECEWIEIEDRGKLSDEPALGIEKSK